MSWTGSENQRRPQGGCVSYGCSTARRFVNEQVDQAISIPAGTQVFIQKIAGGPEYIYRTKKALSFAETGQIDNKRRYVFHWQGWWIFVPRKNLAGLTVEAPTRFEAK